MRICKKEGTAPEIVNGYHSTHNESGAVPIHIVPEHGESNRYIDGTGGCCVQLSGSSVSRRAQSITLFRRSYSTISKALSEMKMGKMSLPSLLQRYLVRPRQRPSWLLMLDVTPQPHPYAGAMPDRGMVYALQWSKNNAPERKEIF